MAKRIEIQRVPERYANYKFELSDDGILFMQCHTEGDSLVWSWKPTTRCPTRSPISRATVRSRC